MSSYDISLVRTGKNIVLYFPAPIKRALDEHGLNRATLEITDQGLLIKPYVGESGRRKQIADLPAWSNES